jgi:hypothetical protein
MALFHRLRLCCFFAFAFLSSDKTREYLKMAMMCVICHNINFQTCAREEKKTLTTSKKAFCKMQFSAFHHNQSGEEKKETEKRDYSRNF